MTARPATAPPAPAPPRGGGDARGGFGGGLGLGGRARRVRRSAGIRLALAYGALFGLSTLALVAFLWSATAVLLNRQVDAAIAADAQGLVERWEQGGAAALQAAIKDRLDEDVDEDAIYFLADAARRRVAGDLPAWPKGALDQPGTTADLPVRRRGSPGETRVRRFDLPDGHILLVGRDMQTRAALRHLLADTLAWTLVLVACLGALGALAVRSLFDRMLANVSATAAAVSAGNLSRRVRLSGRGDEFDRLAEAINDMLDRIGRLMDGVRQVSNAIAHDLRTPITRARARLEDAALHAAGEEELRAALERAVVDLDGVTRVFQALLRIAEIEAGSRRSAFAPLDVAPLLADLAELYGAAAEERGLRLVLDAPERLPAHGDRDLIQQAVANLLDNAVKFSPPGGTVRLRAGAEAGRLWLTVQDEGPGIPVHERARAGERFYRGEAARHTPGFGLGLALVRAVAGLHGGTLRLEDAAPGLSAVLLLPRGPGERGRRPAGATAARG